MKTAILKKIISMTFVLGLAVIANAQSVTFKVNLRPQLEDSVFIPGRDQVYLKGDKFPLTPIKKVYMKDVAPIDSIYQTTVNFSSLIKGERLTYNFYIATPDKVMEEQTPRYIRLSKERELDALYFNSFAW